MRIIYTILALSLFVPFAVAESMALLGDGRYLATATPKSGNLVLVDLKTAQVSTQKIDDLSYADLVGIDQNTIAVLNNSPSGKSILIFTLEVGNQLALQQKLAFGDYFGPYTSLALSSDGKQFATLTENHNQVAFFANPTDLKPSPTTRKSNQMVFVGSDVIAPSRDRAALIRHSPNGKTSRFPLTVKNISSLSISQNNTHLIVSAQRISRLAQTSFDDIHWGSLVSNELRIVPLATLSKPLNKPYLKTKKFLLGDVGSPAPDPSAVVVDQQFNYYVALSGANEIGVFKPSSEVNTRIETGTRPSDLLLDPTKNRLYVFNQLDTSITEIDTVKKALVRTFNLEPKTKLSSIDRGERLFFDASLSHDGWMSCHTCHPNGGSHGYLADTPADGGFDSPKRILDLHGVADSAPYAWNGSKPDLETQVRDSLEQTMHIDRTVKPKEVEDISAFLRSLKHPSKLAKQKDSLVAEGKQVFEAKKCNRCHEAPTYTSKQVFDVGLVDENGNTEFNPPSLRGVADRLTFFHDARTRQLADVFLDHGHPLKEEKLSDKELTQLMAYLKSL